MLFNDCPLLFTGYYFRYQLAYHKENARDPPSQNEGGTPGLLAPSEFENHLFTYAITVAEHVLHIVILNRVSEL